KSPGGWLRTGLELNGLRCAAQGDSMRSSMPGLSTAVLLRPLLASRRASGMPWRRAMAHSDSPERTVCRRALPVSAALAAAAWPRLLLAPELAGAALAIAVSVPG